ncbi:outer membrane beta-barrel protein [Fulvivirgaceae bacterium BMA10]|uniref:Outer membrane beta-barrel protein n=1 Tax=Splendidivirga corallicola TaxID=3051826 RepID=A0ABT8KUF6_9BACT|nr:outer membrane beta-barrel protein [Fulvivirgaceae bacterium BMA10]
MKKIFLVICSIFIGSYIKAQDQSIPLELGIKISPYLISNRSSTESDTLHISGNGANLSLGGGIFLKKSIGSNYYFTSGLIYIPKKVNVELRNNNTNSTIIEKFNLQYLQVPVHLMLFTNEITLDTKIYFLTGLNFEVKISEKNKSNENVYIDTFKFFDTSLSLGTGIEYRLGHSTMLYLGLVYQRGLFNIISEQLINSDSDLVVKNDLFSLDLAIKF